ncbi:methylated-DNA--[protein]-cysteine S-methyltransferase [Psychrobacter sp. I-STPA6b]|uniref:methylated-DNA--[protein]-cysteine S-methyltransferase n=1 Tax=Psychrobacter sp. I-STPA6b TaxID=2585718 RepID=UPI001D0C35F2|nr:methylated-DNA--[protein]-cysteine S-methyltransferase [Psychrobacter sp. I-STPA6b]
MTSTHTSFIDKHTNQANLDNLLAIIHHLTPTAEQKSTAVAKKLNMDFYDSPLGMMCVVADDEYLFLVEFVDRKHIAKELQQLIKKLIAYFVFEKNAITINTITQLNAYFNKKRTQFDLPTKTLGTDFQQSVWQCLLTIPYGSTISYAEQARMMQKDKAVRAVANANAMNRLAIIFPCHRVIGSDVSLTGYAGKIERKAWLLKHEGAL